MNLNNVSVMQRLTVLLTKKTCETGPTVYSPLLRRLKRSYHLLSTYLFLLRPLLLVWPGIEPTASRGVVRWSTTLNWASQAYIYTCREHEILWISSRGLQWQNKLISFKRETAPNVSGFVIINRDHYQVSLYCSVGRNKWPQFAYQFGVKSIWLIKAVG